MIIEAMISVFIWIYNVILRVIGVLPLPEIPASWASTMNSAVDYMESGFGFIYSFVDKNIVIFILSSLMAFMGFLLIYRAMNYLYDKVTP